MPLVIAYGINFSQSTMSGIRTGNMYADDIHNQFHTMACENPQRALAECLLLVLIRTLNEEHLDALKRLR
jgi:hypothetical protein